MRIASFSVLVLAAPLFAQSRVTESAKVEFKAVGPKGEISRSVRWQPGDTRVTLEGLKEGEWRWSARVRGLDWEGPWVESPAGKPDFVVFRGVIEPIALALAGPYLFAFDVVSVLLLAALIGAAFLARKEVKEA